MSYRVKYTTPTCQTGYWSLLFKTRGQADAEVEARSLVTGYTYTVEEVPDVSTAAVPDALPDPTASQWPWQAAPEKPTSTTERLVGMICARHIQGLAKYGTTLDRSDLTPEDWAQHAIEEALDLAGYLMRFKDGFAPEPGSTAAHHVEILRERVKELEKVQKAMHRDLLFALEIGQAMREAMRHGAWGHDGEGHLASVSAGAWDRFKTSLAKAPSVPVGASEAPGEGGDSDRRRLEALRAFLEGNEDASLSWWEGEFNALAEGEAITAPTLLALADKLTEKEGKP